MPITGAFPKEYLAFDQTAVLINGFKYCQLVLRQRIFSGAFQIGNILTFMNGEGDGYLPALNSPLQAYNRGMDAMVFRDLHKLRYLHIYDIILGDIPVRAAGAADGAKTYGLDTLT